MEKFSKVFRFRNFLGFEYENSIKDLKLQFNEAKSNLITEGNEISGKEKRRVDKDTSELKQIVLT